MVTMFVFIEKQPMMRKQSIMKRESLTASLKQKHKSQRKVTFCATVSVPFQEIPKYNEKRRGTTIGLHNLHRSRSDPRLNLTFNGKPPSPCLSSNSYHHYSSNGNLFEPASAGMLFRQSYDSDSPRSMSISSGGSMSGKLSEIF